MRTNQKLHLEKAREVLRKNRELRKRQLEEYHESKRKELEASETNEANEVDNTYIEEDSETDSETDDISEENETPQNNILTETEEDIRHLKELVKSYEDNVKKSNIKVFEKYIRSKIENYEDILENRLKSKSNRNKTEYDIIKDINEMCKNLDDD